MNKKIFKYKIVYWISILTSSLLTVFFCYTSYFRMMTIFANDQFSLFYLVECNLIFLITLFSISAFILLISKKRFAILPLNLSLLLTVVLFLEVTYLMIKQEGDKDIVAGSIVLNSLVIILILIINKFKYKEVKFDNIDLIGRNQD
ncbi:MULTISPECIES: hypothetical protein [Chryseobacterium]|uniref:hypothetical protein n=1 Tax=Chryseobacterium TaxID=59732 RepID=UPI00103290A1|nr:MULTISPECIES: hypothetical protein [Chryseobacterium]QQV04195.1 hypothetical protein I6I61_07630 [Chryseobacterium sp. FDAARGOS 1104]